MKKQKRKLSMVLILAMAVIMALGTVVLTGCGTEQAAAPAEPEPIINPLTGIEMDEELPARPVMVSIPNGPDGAVPQSNTSYADLIYEFPVEWEITRLQAVYYSQFPDKVGPIRSVRYYFVDVARELKAAHVGYGWGKRAKGYMEKCEIPHINGMQDTELFYRVDDKRAPNDAYIDWSSIMDRAEKEGWFDQPKKIKGFKFRDDEWKAEQEEAKAQAQALIDEKGESTAEEDVEAVEEAKKLLEEPQKAKSVFVSSISCKSESRYNEETGLYDRYWYGEPHIDKETGEQLSFSNIIVQYVHSDPMTDSMGLPDDKGRIEIDMAAGGDALLFTNGEVIKGKWSRKDLASRTIYKDENGRQFRLTPGKTWIYIVDQNMECKYE